MARNGSRGMQFYELPPDQVAPGHTWAVKKVAGAGGNTNRKGARAVSSRMSIVSLLLVLGVASANAQAPNPPLTLEDCVELALKAPSAASLAGQQVEIARADETIARSALLPQFSFNNGLLYNSPLANRREQFSFVAANGFREYVSSVDSAWEVDLSGRLRAGLALARANERVAGADLRLQRRDLRRAVATAYYDVLLTRRIAQLAASSLSEARAFEERSRKLQAQGEASLADVHKATAQRANFEQRLSEAHLNAQLANQILASFWTRDVDRPLQLQDVLENPPAPPAEGVENPAAIEQAIAQRPELEQLNALRSGARAERAAAKAAFWPQTTVLFQYGIDSNNVRIADRGYAAIVNLSVPLFDWSQRRSALSQARYREQQVDQQQTIAERAFSREYLAARAAVRSWHERIPLARSEFAEATENLRLARLLYEGGEGLALDVVSAQVQAADAGTAVYSTIAAYLRSVIDFEVASGQ
jgi:outer membrane protein